MVRLVTLLWVVLCLVYTWVLIEYQRASISRGLVTHTSSLASDVSQRVNQHDAHLTSLAAVALSGEEPDAALFTEVVAAIEQFYPRVTAVDLISLSGEETIVSSRLSQSNNEILHGLMREISGRSDGNLELAVSLGRNDRYLIVKRVPNSNAARYALSLEIDVPQLVSVESSSLDSFSALSVSMPDGTLLSQLQRNDQTIDNGWFQPLVIENVAQSRTQPMRLKTVVQLGTSALLPLGPLLIGIFAIAFSLLTLVMIIRLLRKSRRDELRARLGEQDAKISHASRVNSLGELSSGIAHELTQPLTAILSQSQAGIRLLKQGGDHKNILEGILSTNVVQAKRASDILARLREWSKQTNESTIPTDINECVQNVLFLIDGEMRNHAVQLNLQLSPDEPHVMGDAVGIEQVIFNIIRNALDKSSPEDNPSMTIELITSELDGRVSISVMDDGYAIDDGMLSSIFEPFVSSKQNGMGLGLALCERIVERLDGKIELSNEPIGVKAVVSFPAL